MKLNNLALSIIVLVFIFGGIGSSMIFNVWQSNPDKITTISTDGNSVIPYNPANIRGTNTFEEISQMFNIPLSDFGTAFGLNSVENFAGLTARELKTVYPNLEKGKTIETESVRIFVSMYKNKTYVYSNTAYLPQSAVKILKEKAKLSTEQLEFLEAHTININSK